MKKSLMKESLSNATEYAFIPKKVFVGPMLTKRANIGSYHYHTGQPR